MRKHLKLEYFWIAVIVLFFMYVTGLHREPLGLREIRHMVLSRKLRKLEEVRDRD